MSLAPKPAGQMRQIRHFRSRETNTRLETPRCGDGSAFGRAPAAAGLKRQRSTKAKAPPTAPARTFDPAALFVSLRPSGFTNPDNLLALRLTAG